MARRYATIAFLGINGERLTLSNDEAYELVMAVATGTMDDVANIAAALRCGTTRRQERERHRLAGQRSRRGSHHELAGHITRETDAWWTLPATRCPA